MSEPKRTGSATDSQRTGADRSPSQPLRYLRRAERRGSGRASLAAGSSALSPWALAGLAAITCGGWACQAAAQTAGGIAAIQGLTPLPASDPSQNFYGTDTGAVQLAQANAGGQSSAPLIPITAPNPVTNPYAAADDLKIRGYNIPFPYAVDTLDQGAGGLRNALAADGIGYTGISSTTFSSNVLRHGLPAGNQFGPHSRDNQLYAGQLPTYVNQETLYVTYDLRRFGIPDGQILVAGQLTSTNWNPGGPDGFDLATATYYQTFLNKKIEFKIGALNNFLEFLGPNVGNSLANGIFGPAASLSIENGLDASSFTTYGVNLTYHVTPGFYVKGDLSRGISPDGSIAEKLANPTGLNLTVRNAGLISFDEAGYKVEAKPGQNFTWIRAAGDYSSSNYQLLNNRPHRGSPNYGVYLFADQQILQTALHPNPRSAFRGLYAGFTIEYAPQYFDTFTRYFEGRVYGFGLIPGRPRDLASMVISHNVYSEDAVQAAERFGLLAHHNVTALTASYGLRVVPGVNINLGIQYTDHPTVITYNRSTGSALNLLANAFIFL